MGNWWNKDQRREQAAAHEAYVHTHFQNDVTAAIDSSFSIGGNDIFAIADKLEEKQTNTMITLLQADTVKAIEWTDDKHPCVLNFASFHNPGGKYIDGALAQEEALCHKSNLYAVLSSHKFNSFYNRNRRKEINNEGLYSDRAIFSNDISFYKDDYNILKKCSVITCAAPNKNAALRYHSIEETTNYKALDLRILTTLAIANEYGGETFITGAYGCGVFGQYPSEVASLYLSNLSKYNFSNLKQIIFAIPPDSNLKAFRETFNWYCKKYDYDIIDNQVNMMRFYVDDYTKRFRTVN